MDKIRRWHIPLLAVYLLTALRAGAQEPSACSGNAGGGSGSSGCPVQPDGGLTTVEAHFNTFSHGFTNPWSLVQTFGAPVVTAGFSQLVTSHAGFSSDAAGFGEHYGVNVVGNVSGKVLAQFLLPVAFRQDNRYVSDCGASVPARIGHIFWHILLTRSADDSHKVFNMSAVPSSLLNAGLSNTYLPRQQRTAAAAAQRFGWNMFGFSAGDAFGEFSPELSALGKRVESGLAKLWPWHSTS